MLIVAAVGAIANLAVLAWIWHLRAQPSAQWRKREVTRKEKRSERLQVVLAIVTLLLVGFETWTHTLIHRKGPPPPSIHSSES
jgi:sterol desaturase/sphingolipid hydroxylase (fatty acid hydroxylase superfamily)